MNRYVIIIFLFLSSYSALGAGMSFEEMYAVVAIEDYRATADQIVSARFEESELSLQQKYTRLKTLQSRIKLHTENYGEDPMVWFLSGLNLNNLAEVRYLMVLNQSGQQKADTDTQVSNYNIARSRAYDNAIRLDSQQPHKLSSAIYATMGYGLSNRQKIKTYTRELELGSPSENESNEWFMHWAKIDALVHEKKLDEAQAAIAELKDLLDKRNKTDTAYSGIVSRAETQVEKVVEKSQDRNKKQPPPKARLEKTSHAWDWKTWLLIGIGVFTFVSVIIAAISLRKR